jgi:hypothetical protein
VSMSMRLLLILVDIVHDALLVKLTLGNER